MVLLTPLASALYLASLDSISRNSRLDFMRSLHCEGNRAKWADKMLEKSMITEDEWDDMMDNPYYLEVSYTTFTNNEVASLQLLKEVLKIRPNESKMDHAFRYNLGTKKEPCKSAIDMCIKAYRDQVNHFNGLMSRGDASFDEIQYNLNMIHDYEEHLRKHNIEF